MAPKAKTAGVNSFFRMAVPVDDMVPSRTVVKESLRLLGLKINNIDRMRVEQMFPILQQYWGKVQEQLRQHALGVQCIGDRV